MLEYPINNVSYVGFSEDKGKFLTRSIELVVNDECFDVVQVVNNLRYGSTFGVVQVIEFTNCDIRELRLNIGCGLYIPYSKYGLRLQNCNIDKIIYSDERTLDINVFDTVISNLCIEPINPIRFTLYKSLVQSLKTELNCDIIKNSLVQGSDYTINANVIAGICNFQADIKLQLNTFQNTSIDIDGLERLNITSPTIDVKSNLDLNKISHTCDDFTMEII